MKDFYQVKGSKVEDLHKFAYYDEVAGERIQRILERAGGIKPIGKRSDKYFELELDNPHYDANYQAGYSDPRAKDRKIKVLLIHEPQEKGPNANRIWRDKEVISGEGTTWPNDVRLVIAFDQHTAGSVVIDVNGRPVNVVNVGSVTSNSNAGQNAMAAVLDLEGFTDGTGQGNTYHITYEGLDGKIGPPRVPGNKQIQHVPYVPDRTNRPDALQRTTDRSSVRPR